MVICEEIFKRSHRKTKPKIWKEPFLGICQGCNFCERGAVIAGPGINRKTAEQFVAAHFKLPVQIFLADEWSKISLVKIGSARPRGLNRGQLKAQPVFIPKPKDGKGFEFIISINLFNGVQLKRGEDAHQIMLAHGYGPKEIRKILKQGIAYFQKRKEKK